MNLLSVSQILKKGNGPHFVIEDGKVIGVLTGIDEYSSSRRDDTDDDVGVDIDPYEEDYESISELSRKELLDKINYQIGEWLASREDEEDVSNFRNDKIDEDIRVMTYLFKQGR